jgi:hypothetical protein
MRLLSRIVLALSLMFLCNAALARDAKDAHYRLDGTKNLDMIGGKAESVAYRGRNAIHLVPAPGPENGDHDTMAVLTGPDFKNGTIEIDVAGSPRAGAPPDSSGFIGVRVGAGLSLGTVAQGDTRRLRVVCRYGYRGVDQDEDRCFGNEGTTIREWGYPAGASRQRPEAGR